jgi:hypothetical protein
VNKAIFLSVLLCGTSLFGEIDVPSYRNVRDIQNLEAFYGISPDDIPDFGGDGTTGIGGGSFDLNTFLGADRYYDNSTPITGQNAVAFNLEAGHLWNGHETMQHVTGFVNSADTWGGGEVEPLYDRHATWASMLIGGRQTTVNPDIKQQGLAPGADLRSAAIATGWSGNAYALSFGISADSYITAFTSAFGTADVINSSYGYTDANGTSAYTQFSDAMSYQSPTSLHVVSAGNSGSSSNTVGAPGSGYNTMAVAALGDANSYNSTASFSSRGPQDFGYYSAEGVVTVSGVRAAVDIAAPGTSITSAFYGGQTGGNNDTLTGSIDEGSNANAYSTSINGTSFSAPIVAGGASLLASAAKTLPGLAGNSEAGQNLVIKSILMTAADKTSGWDNGQQTVSAGSESYIQTTQSLDWETGAGRMNLDRAFDVQVDGQQGVTGSAEGALGSVAAMGWDYGQAQLGTANEYIINDPLQIDTTFTTTLAWMRWREWDSDTGDLYEIAQADLDLSVWKLDESNAFSELIAISESEYNNEEHLSFTIPGTARYGIRIGYDGNTFDNTTLLLAGSDGYEQNYAVSWFGTAIPEPGMAMLMVFLFAKLIVMRRVNAHLKANSREG